MLPIWKEGLVDIIKLKILRGDHLRLLEQTLNPVTNLLIRDKRGKHTDTQRGGGKVIMKAETGVRQPSGMPHPLEDERGKEEF